RRRHTRFSRDWSSDVCSSDLGTYIFETPGVIHQFINGPTVTEAVFVSTGDLELIDPESLELAGAATPAQILDQYVAKCEAIGVKIGRASCRERVGIAVDAVAV